MRYKTFIFLVWAGGISLFLTLIVLTGTVLYRVYGSRNRNGESEEILRLESNQRQLIDSNRRMLSLLELDAPAFNEGNEVVSPFADDDISFKDGVEVAFYDLLLNFEEELMNEEYLISINSFLNNPELEKYLIEKRLKVSRSNSFSFAFLHGEAIWFKGEFREGVVHLNSIEDTEGLTGQPQFTSQLKKYMDDWTVILSQNTTDFGLIRRAVSETLRSSAVRSIVDRKDIRIEPSSQGWIFLNKTGMPVGRIEVDERTLLINLNEKEFSDSEDVQTRIISFFNDVDARSEEEKKTDEMRGYIEGILKDEAYLQYLKSKGLTPVSEIREDEYYFYYDLADADGERVGSFGLQKRVGEVYFMDRDDVRLRSLKSFIPEAALFKSSTEGEKAADSSQRFEGTVMLLIGTHDNNADTIMLACADKNRKSITLISLPRDLYFRGLKINMIYSSYGIRELMRSVYEITGLEVDHSIVIDMYAFVEVIDLLGGVDIYLEKPLVDPTYKVKVMGEWKTLLIPSGYNHLDGLGALRYARSRHTSNDFDRSKRQQEIISATKERIQKVKISNVAKLSGFVRLFYKYVKTDLSVMGVARLWLTLKSYEMKDGNTIDTTNILYETYSELYRLPIEEREEALANDNRYKGAYILLPRGNDWSLIRSYIRNVLIS